MWMTASALQIQAILSVGPLLLVITGAATGWYAVRLYRRWQTDENDLYTDLLRPYLHLCVVFAVGIATIGFLQMQVNRTRDLLLALSFAMFLPWTAFALNFVGRGHLLTPRRKYAGLILLGLLITEAFVQSSPGSPVSLFASVLALVILAVVFTAVGLVGLSTYRHRNVPLRHGVIATLPVIEIIVGVQLLRSSMPLLNDAVSVVLSLSVGVTLFVATTRYDILRMRPGTGAAGERTAVREMDEAVITVEPDGTLARLNDTAAELFGVQLKTDSIAEVLETDLPNLSTQESIECWTENGRQQFDPRVTEMTNDYGEVYGYTVILIDVTERNIRRQRIEVLNRILRHNIRNSLDVIRANVESLNNEHRRESVLSVTDTLEELSGDARRIESLLRQSEEHRSSADIGVVAERVAEDVREMYPAATISITQDNELCATDAEVSRFALRNVLENAVVHNNSDHILAEVRVSNTETGVQIVVADNGPGIPDAERAVIETETESPHSHTTGLGLWGTSWTVTQLGGDLSFRESELGGTAVSIELPASPRTTTPGQESSGP